LEESVHTFSKDLLLKIHSKKIQPENPIRRFIIGPQIFQIIKGALMDPELEELPTDYLKGVDFRIKLNIKGGSQTILHQSGARRERSLVSKSKHPSHAHGLFTLSDFLTQEAH
jgi:hypothetical protein